MIPIGIGAAASVRAGREIGRADAAAAGRAAGAALTTGTLFMAVTAALFLAAPGLLGRAFTDAGVVRIAALLLPIARVSRLFDGL